MDNATNWWLAQLLMQPVRDWETDDPRGRFRHLGKTARAASLLPSEELPDNVEQNPGGRREPSGTVYPNPFSGPLYRDDATMSQLWNHMMFDSTPVQRQRIYTDDKNMDPASEMFDPRFTRPGALVRGGAPALPSDRFMRAR